MPTFSEYIRDCSPGAMKLEKPVLSKEDMPSLRRFCEVYRAMEYPLLKASQYMAFARRGDRAAWEKPWFLRRRKLIAALMDALYFGGDTDAVIDGLWLICEESTWVISAHNGAEHAGVEPTPPKPLPEGQPYVDLFAAQTAMILSLTCALLPALPEVVRHRAYHEIEVRVLIPFETRDDFWWMGIIRKDLCNWTPWIVSNVMLSACVLIEDKTRLSALLSRACAMLDRYVDSLPDDGGCDEGPGYWSMAGGALLDCLELLERVTNNEMALWKNEKLKNILRFPMRMWLGGEWFANFADCDAKPDIPGERLQCAGEKLNDPALTAFGAHFRGDPTKLVEDTPQLWRLLNALSRPRMNAGEAQTPEDVWLPNLEVRIVSRGGVALACKGGVNEGSHNHNDCGGFMVCIDGMPQIIDAGNMTYTGKTFSDARYTLWNIRSRYHSVPQIGEYEQVNGWERRARAVECAPDGLAMDIAPAYPNEAGVLTCRRELHCDGWGVTMRDAVVTQTPQTLTEVFMLRRRDGVTITPSIPMESEIEEIPIDDPRMAKNYPGSLWRLAFTVPAALSHDLTFRIERKAS